MNLTYLIKRPIITEKSLQLASSHRYTFEVDPQASKFQIKAAVAKIFKVDVLSVHTINITGKTQRKRGRRGFYQTPNWKKAIIQLPKHQTIDLFETEEQKQEKTKDKKAKAQRGLKTKEQKNIETQKPAAAVAQKDQETQKVEAGVKTARPKTESLKDRLTQRIRRTTSK